MIEKTQSINTNDQNKIVVLVGGCFDVLHYGHIEFLKQAKRLGNYLLVALESDENVRRRKGDLRPIHTQEQRKTMLEALSCVDEVLPLPTMTSDDDYKQLVQTIKPQIIAVTKNDPYLTHKQQQANAVNARVVEIPKIHTPSTSQLAKLIGLE
ncbi:MAG: FAD synthase [Patescibacteria group bacterium]|nr:FAD synthase [Patescibacteria group bacterium]